MDGIDAAVFRISPVEIYADRPPRLQAELVGSHLQEFETGFAQQLKQLIGGKSANLDTICRLNFALGEVFADAVTEAVSSLRLDLKEIDLIGSHGQTIWHAPNAVTLWGEQSRSTLQLATASPSTTPATRRIRMTPVPFIVPVTLP